MRLLRGNAFDHPTDRGSVAKRCQYLNRSTRVDLANGCPVRALTKHTHDDVNTRNTCPASSGTRDKQSAAFSPRTGRFHILYLPHFEPEPHSIGTGWSVLLCAAAFGLGVMAAADGNYNPPLSAPHSSPGKAVRICTEPRNLPGSDGTGLRLLPDTLEVGPCDVVPGLAPMATAAPHPRSSMRSSSSRR
jgi:hypothetical protein